MGNASVEQFEGLFKEHHYKLCSLANNIVNDDDAARDIVQEVFIKLWNKRDQLDFSDQISHYLYKATSHSALNHLRNNKKLIQLDTEALNQTAAPSVGENNLDELERKVNAAIEKLPPKCRTIYIMSRQEGLRYKEIAEALELSVKTIENQMGIALQKIREELKPVLDLRMLALLGLLGLMLLLVL